MPSIINIEPVSSIKAGPGSSVEPDGTILNPEPYEAANITFDDGVTVQVERPLTVAKLQAAYKAATALKGATLDGISPGDVITP